MPAAEIRHTLTAALRYASRGWPVFPCRSRGKRPCTAHGLNDATTDAALIEAWWESWPNANVAFRTGHTSGIVVLDVDGDDGTESLRALERQHDRLPRTASVITPRRGRHFYFTHPGGEIPSTAGHLGSGLDIRGDGGYVVAPPSVGGNGRRYELDERRRPAALPPWLVERIVKSAGKHSTPVPAAVWVAIVRDGLPVGKRNQGLARFVGHLLARDVDARLVRELAHLVAQRFTPPLASTEVDRVVESIAGRELAQRRNGRRWAR